MLYLEDYLLRPVSKEDLAMVLAWRNSDRIRAVMFTDELITQEEHRAWFERLQKNDDMQCLVCEREGRPIGVVNVSRIDRKNSICEWGFYLGETDVPRGAGTVMGRLALRYIFEVLGIRKVVCKSFAFNQGSIRYQQRLGFVEEGRFRQHVVKNGKFEDVLSFALLREEWLQLEDR